METLELNELLKQTFEFEECVVKELYIGDVNYYSADVLVAVVECDGADIPINDEWHNLTGVYLFEFTICDGEWVVQISLPDGEILGFVCEWYNLN